MADDLKQFIEEKTEETKRHFDVVAENLEKNIVGAMKEELQLHGQQIEALQMDGSSGSVTVTRGTPVSITGRIITTSGSAVANRLVVLQFENPSGSGNWQSTGSSGTTNFSGNLSWSWTPAPAAISTRYRLHWGGDGFFNPSDSSSINVTVSAPAQATTLTFAINGSAGPITIP